MISAPASARSMKSYSKRSRSVGRPSGRWGPTRRSRPARSVACGWTWSWPGSAWWPAGSGGGPSYAIRPSCTTTARSISGCSGPSSWATSRIVPPAAAELAQRGRERLLAGRVDPGGRLVEHQQVGLAGQGAGDQGALLLAAGQGGDRVVDPVQQADIGERVAYGRAVGRARGPEDSAPGQPARGHHLADGGRHAAAGAQPLRHVADPGPVLEAAQVGAEQLDVAAARRHQAEHGADQGRLAGAVGAEDRDHLARPAPAG